MTKTKNFIYVSHDLAFRYIFKHKDILTNFLEDLLEIKISSLEILDSVIEKENKKQKEIVTDILTLVNHEIYVNIEMQNTDNGDIEKRITYYLGKIINNSLKGKERYEMVKKFIMVCIINYNQTKFKEYVQNSYLSYREEDLKKEKSEKQKLENIKYYVVNLKSKNPKIRPKLKEWIEILKEEGRIDMEKYTNKRVQKVAKLIEKLNADPDALQLYEFYEKKRRDIASGLAHSKEMGIEEGTQNTIRANAENLFKNGASKKLICDSLNISLSNLNQILAENNISH